MNKYKKLKDILDKYDEAIEKISKEFISELKNNCKTYGDVYKELKRFDKEIKYNYSDEVCKNTIFITYVDSLIEKEKNDLQVTNRLEKKL
jgi:hypothetical protein